jgi:type I restriction enzyme, S subunit
MSEWPMVRLEDCAEIVSGATPSTSESAYWDGDVCWATPKDLSELDGAYISDTPRKITRGGLQSCAASVLPPDSVLFSSRAPIGHVAINTVPMATNQGFKSFVPKRDRVHAKFLYHWLRRNRPYLETLGNGATFKEVSKAVVARIEIPLPPMPQQRRIAAILDKADALRAKRRAALAQLDTLTQSIFLDMFGDPIENSRKFPVRPMIELVDRARPISYGILMPGPDQTDGVKYVRVVDMRDGGIELSGIRKTSAVISNAFRRSLLKAGDLLMSIRGHVGRFAVVPTELDGANITQDSARLAVVGADPVFVRECLRTEAFQRWMAKHTKGVAVRGINLGDVKLMPIILPELSAQREFARVATETSELRASKRASLAALDALFASLQHRAFRGEL